MRLKLFKKIRNFSLNLIRKKTTCNTFCPFWKIYICVLVIFGSPRKIDLFFKGIVSFPGMFRECFLRNFCSLELFRFNLMNEFLHISYNILANTRYDIYILENSCVLHPSLSENLMCSRDLFKKVAFSKITLLLLLL